MSDDPQWTQGFELLPLYKGELGIRGAVASRTPIHEALFTILEGGGEITSTLQAAAADVTAIRAEYSGSSAVVPPEGGTLVYTTTDGLTATVEIAGGTLATTETISYAPLNDLPTDGLAFALVPNLAFSQPVTITLRYRDEDILGMDESSLILYNYDWASHSWVDAEPCGGYQRDLDNNILYAAVCHFSDYSLIDRPYKVFLPASMNGD